MWFFCYFDTTKAYKYIRTWNNSALSPDFGSCESILARKCVFLTYILREISDTRPIHMSFSNRCVYQTSHKVYCHFPQVSPMKYTTQSPILFLKNTSRISKSHNQSSQVITLDKALLYVWTTRWEKSFYFPQSWETRKLRHGHGNQLSADWDLCTFLFSYCCFSWKMVLPGRCKNLIC